MRSVLLDLFIKLWVSAKPFALVSAGYKVLLVVFFATPAL